MSAASALSAPSEVAPDLHGEGLQDRLRQFLRSSFQAELAVGPLKRYSSGFSWITFGFSARWIGRPAQELIVQIGPPTGMFAPYSARPQALALASLKDSRVPVAALVAWSDDPAILGAPFFICEKVAGEVIEPWRLQSIDPGRRARLAEAFVEILGHLHAPGTPVGALQSDAQPVTPENAVELEIDHWSQRLREWACKPLPLLSWSERWLRSNVRAAPRLCIVHGDFRLGNFLADDTRVSAVLDWEMVHVGHPLEDLGWLFSATFNKGSRRLFGELEREAALDRYATVSGIRVADADLHYFECLALYKSIAITVAAQYSAQRRGYNDMRMTSMATQIAVMTRQLDRLIGGQT
ncbi:phosphotransferase family protein [Ramlibacter tataouinensis]|uniref:phosphotransferase family protein n=1 Tax=Ramlibacter tataouinensis TaxID=94132 RepID=UPI0022F3B5B8|nr:phosphotransferase family protein [Ramlibacter tataouinensis]WBY03084.1 phosphotransferase family protein [Ramlibacter tataouinensis]